MSHKSSLEDISDPNINNIQSENESNQDDPKKIMQILYSEDVYESPVDINISKTIPVNAVQNLRWYNFELLPKKIKVTNSGHTVILSGKWGEERPYITNGTLSGKYVFSQAHFHWGVNDMEGSEHTVDNCRYPGEMHVVTFKSSYLTQESALKETDGVVILVYIFRLQDHTNPSFQIIIDALPGIAKAHTSAKLVPVQLGCLVRQFESDYFMYRGSIITIDCVHNITWLITRVPIGVSPDQVDSFRFLLDDEDDLIRRNFRYVQPLEGRHIFHVLPSGSKYSTLLPIPEINIGERASTQIYRFQLLYNNDTKNLFEKIRRNVYVKWQLKMKSRCKKRKSSNFQYYYIQLANQMLSVIEDLSKNINIIFYNVVCVFFINNNKKYYT